MSNIIPFNFRSHDVRVIQDKNGSPLFVAKDIAEILGYERPSDAISQHCKKAQAISDVTYGETPPPEIHPSLKLIPESDVYRLTMRSQLDSAEIFQDWVVEDVIPSIRKTGSYSIKQDQQEIKPVIEANKLFKSNLSIAKSIFKGNQAILSANQATRKITNIDVLDNLGATALISETKETLMTASDIGKQIGLSGMKVNLLLEKNSLLKSFRDAKNKKVWELTNAGENFGESLDTGKRHGDGTPVKQIKWYTKVLDLLKNKAA